VSVTGTVFPAQAHKYGFTSLPEN